MNRAELLRLIALAPLGATLAGCDNDPVSVVTNNAAETERDALMRRSASLYEKIERESGASRESDLLLDALVRDIELWQRRHDRQDVAVRTGLGIEDIPESIRAARVPTYDPDNPCPCRGYWSGCIMYIPRGEDTCEQGSCLFVCIDWFCALFPNA